MTSKRKRKKDGAVRGTITRRWILNNLVLVFLVLLVLDFAFMYAIQNYYYGASRQYLTTKVTSVSGVLNRYAQDADTNFSSEMRSTIENFSDKDKMELMAINARGRVILTSSGFSQEEDTAMPDYEQAMENGSGYWVGKVNGETMMAVSVDISDVSTDYSAIRVVASLEQIQGAVHTYAVAVGAVCCGVLLLLVVTGVYFIRSIIRPIKQISATTRKFAKGDFSVRIDSQSHDEIGDLCASINQMADELSNTENMKNEFISSVSHELRTPLTAISGWGETLLGDETGDPRQLRRGLRIIVKEARRLTGMVEELLEFSKMQDGRFTLQVEEMDLQAELEDAIYTYRELFRQDGIELNYHSDQELYTEPISGDPQRLKQVFCNVLDNAAKHGGAGKRIDVDMTQEGDSYVVRIRDYGPGIPPAEVPFVKQKFYKGSSKARGSGIGLAVCDEIVQHHGGVFDIGNADGGGAIVTIRLPISGQEL